MILTALYLGVGIILVIMALVSTRRYLQLSAAIDDVYMTPQLWLWLLGVVSLYVVSLVLIVIGALRILK